jgi:hypothetical protein
VPETNESPDPLPEETPGLEPGGSVQPGDTPPAEAGTIGVSTAEAKLPGRRTNAIIAIVIVVLLAAAGLALLVARLG